VNEEVKIEDKNILDGFKDQFENNFMKSNNEENCIDTASCQNQKRKRKEEPIINDVKEENVEIAISNHNKYELLEEIQENYTKIHD